MSSPRLHWNKVVPIWGIWELRQGPNCTLESLIHTIFIFKNVIFLILINKPLIKFVFLSDMLKKCIFQFQYYIESCKLLQNFATLRRYGVVGLIFKLITNGKWQILPLWFTLINHFEEREFSYLYSFSYEFKWKEDQ